MILQAATSTRRRVPLLVNAFSHVFAFRQTPTELIFGFALLYYCRLFERLQVRMPRCQLLSVHVPSKPWVAPSAQGTHECFSHCLAQGSNKYGSYVLVTCTAAYLLEAAVAAAGGPRGSSGLTPLLFANLIPFVLDIPPLHKFSFFGWSMTDKVFIYLAAFQLLFSGHRRSLAAGVCGAIAGLLFRFNFAGMRSFRLPPAVIQLFSSSLGRVLVTPGDRQQVFLTVPSQQQAASGAQVRERATAAAAQVHPLPEAVEQLVAMGFDPASVRRALQEAGNNVELALQQLL